MRELLLCPPDYYGIEYEINPWMSRSRGAEVAVAQKQWEQLHATLSNLSNGTTYAVTVAATGHAGTPLPRLSQA